MNLFPSLQTWDGVAKGDVFHKRISATLARIKKQIEGGHIESFIANLREGASPSKMHAKSLKAGAHDRKVINPQKALETQLLSWCKKMWKENKKTTRHVIFHRALQIDPSHCGGKNDLTLMSRLKGWFYYGFKQRMKLSNCVVSSTGQKLPKDWQTKTASIVGRVRYCQMHCQRRDGSFQPGVKDKKMGNSDHLPMWVEPHGKY